MAAPLLAGTPAILNPEAMRRHVETFNRHDHTHFGQTISNEAADPIIAEKLRKLLSLIHP